MPVINASPKLAPGRVRRGANTLYFSWQDEIIYRSDGEFYKFGKTIILLLPSLLESTSCPKLTPSLESTPRTNLTLSLESTPCTKLTPSFEFTPCIKLYTLCWNYLFFVHANNLAQEKGPEPQHG